MSEAWNLRRENWGFVDQKVQNRKWTLIIKKNKNLQFQSKTQKNYGNSKFIEKFTVSTFMRQISFFHNLIWWIKRIIKKKNLNKNKRKKINFYSKKKRN